MTDIERVSLLSVEDRLALIEGRLGLITPLALVPPITIGELTDVPAPGSQIAAQWAQEVSARIIHHFPTFAALSAWAAPAGSRAVQTDTGIEWRRIGGAWSQVTPWTSAVAGTGLSVGGTPAGTYNLATINVPADPGPRLLTVSCLLRVDKYQPTGTVAVRLLVAGSTVGQYDLVQEQTESYPTGFLVPRFANMTVSSIAASPAGTAVTLQVIATGTQLAGFGILANPAYNRLDVRAEPRGY